jgi:tetratricopeptide (TPR) repeat protein
VVVLKGSSGVGKSRIVRELYDRLRAEQASAYWPPLAGVEGTTAAGADAMAARKEIAPRVQGFVWPADTLPGFAWWGFNCERMANNTTVDVIALARPQLDAHQIPLLMAWREVAGLGDKIKQNRQKMVSAIRDASIDEAADKLMDVLAGFNVVVPFAGTLVKWGWSGVKAARERWRQQALLGADVDLGDQSGRERRSVGEDLAGVVRQVAHPGLPAVVAVEDMHLMGEECAAFVDAVSTRAEGKPVLVVGTAWPEGFHEGTHPVFADWLARATRRGIVEVVDCPVLDAADMTALLRQYGEAPRTDDATARSVVDRLVTPHFLKLWLDLPRTRSSIRRHGGAVVLDSDLRLPDSVAQVLREMWASLPGDVRAALLYAAAVNPLKDPLSQFVPGIASEIAHRFDEKDVAAMLDALRDAERPLAWCQTSAGLEFFREPTLADTARRAVGEEFSAEDVRDLEDIARTCLTKWIEDERDGIDLPPGDATESIAQWHLALNPDAAPSPVQAAALRARMRAAASRYDLQSAITWGTRVLSSVAECQGPDHPDTLTSRNDLATAYASAGRLGDAIPLMEANLAERERVLGPDHPGTLTSRNNLAHAYRSAGRLGDAIPLFEAALADVARVLAPDHPGTLTARNNLAQSYRSAGRPGDAIPQYEANLADSVRVQGPDHPHTLTSRNNLAYAYWSAGRLGDAIPLLEATLADRERVLGPDHPDTLVSRNNLAGAYESAGRLAHAIPLHEANLADSVRVLGPDHPYTLTMRNNLATAHGSSGRWGDAIPPLEAVLADRERVLGPDHPDTLRSRNNLAHAYRSAGRSDDAIPLFEATLADHARVLGPDHPDTLTSRNNLANAYRSAGRLSDAIPLLEATLADQERVLGPDHPDTLRSRNNLGGAYESAGRPGDAIPLLEATVADQERVLGSDHPDTLVSRNNLAYIYHHVGRPHDAIPLYEASVAASVRALGPDHPETLASRNDLANTYWSAGRPDDAISQWEKAVSVAVRVLGEAHPQTRLFRYNLELARLNRR